MTAIAEGCPHLVSIDLVSNRNISDTSLSAIARHCPKLTSIDLKDCLGVSDMGILAIAEGCPHLVYFRFHRLSDTLSSTLRIRFPRLVVSSRYRAVSQ